MSELRECPFMETGEELEHGVGVLPFRGWFSVECMCGAAGPKRRTEQEAKEAWNTRHTPKHETVEQTIKKVCEQYDKENGEYVESAHQGDAIYEFYLTEYKPGDV
ncbi:MAG: hypothetical protein GY804_02675 [Alphaproteobacteria bacterium]|nr:hypothetical protein [Alphaproteobacteria bacterium]